MRNPSTSMYSISRVDRSELLKNDRNRCDTSVQPEGKLRMSEKKPLRMWWLRVTQPPLVMSTTWPALVQANRASAAETRVVRVVLMAWRAALVAWRFTMFALAATCDVLTALRRVWDGVSEVLLVAARLEAAARRELALASWALVFTVAVLTAVMVPCVDVVVPPMVVIWPWVLTNEELTAPVSACVFTRLALTEPKMTCVLARDAVVEEINAWVAAVDACWAVICVWSVATAGCTLVVTVLVRVLSEACVAVRSVRMPSALVFTALALAVKVPA